MMFLLALPLTLGIICSTIGLYNELKGLNWKTKPALVIPFQLFLINVIKEFKSLENKLYVFFQHYKLKSFQLLRLLSKFSCQA